MPPPQSVHFKGTEEHSYDGYVEIPQEIFGLVHAGTILEFGWDYENQKLFPTRIRNDKIKPNFINTAISTWEDIFHPISEKDFISLSTYVINPKNDSVLIAKQICEFIKKTMDAGILYKLGEYLGSNKIPNTFNTGFKIAQKFGIRNRVVEAISRNN